MTKKINKTLLIKDFHEGVLYADMAIKHKCHVTAIAYHLKKLGLGRNKQTRELFSAEEKNFMRALINTSRGRKQLLDILKDE